jgi:glutamine synthetase
MYLVEYVWLDGFGKLRSKMRVLETLESIPKWNYDGSSTGQAEGNNSEITLNPCRLFKTKPITDIAYVLCDTYDEKGVPTKSNNRCEANKMFNKNIGSKPWFGMEQEYFMLDPLSKTFFNNAESQGQYYCGVGSQNARGREIALEHAKLCLKYGIKISGINAEVAPCQWEFQVGPCVGIEAGDHLWMARYFLHLLSEKYNVIINMEPKPLKGDWNGSGCHVNFSTDDMRYGKVDKTGLECINEAIEKLSEKHKEHMEVYGKDNNQRMTGEHETADYNVFTNGVANRGASIRIGHETLKNEMGYFEDRRPSSNCDPYLVTSKIFETTVL